MRRFQQNRRFQYPERGYNPADRFCILQYRHRRLLLLHQPLSDMSAGGQLRRCQANTPRKEDRPRRHTCGIHLIPEEDSSCNRQEHRGRLHRAETAKLSVNRLRQAKVSPSVPV